MNDLYQKNKKEETPSNGAGGKTEKKSEDFEIDKVNQKEHNTDEKKSSDISNEEKEEELEDVVFEDESFVDPIKKIRENLKNCRKEKQEYLQGLQRARADYSNLNRKIEEEKEIASFKKEEEIFEKFFQVIDSFESAFSNEKLWESVDENWRKGIEQIYSNVRSIFKEYKIEQINPMDEDFDPNIHEPFEVISVENKKEDNKIKEVIQKGYKRREKVLRPARVKVGQFKK